MTTRFRVHYGRIAAVLGLAALFSIVPTIALVNATPCPTEDSTWCHWDAQTHGNGQGRSFTTYWEGFTLFD